MTSSSSQFERNSNGAASARCGAMRDAPDTGKSSHTTTSTPTKAPSELCLSAAIESEVIPRLLLAHRRDAANASVEGEHLTSAASIVRARQKAVDGANRKARARRHHTMTDEALAHLAVRESAQRVLDYVDGLRRAGMSLEALFLDVLGPAARRLGQFWNDDVYSFTDVTVGLCRLRQVFEELRSQAPHAPASEAGNEGDQFCALIAPAPGDDHSFGAAMIAHLFTQAGWTVFSEPAGDESTLMSELKGRRIDLLGLSINSERALERLASFVLKVRRESKNRNLVIILGGSLVSARPEIARDIGVIAAPADPQRAIEQAELFVRRAARRM